MTPQHTPAILPCADSVPSDAARLMDVEGGAAEGLWTPQELAQILRHRLSATLGGAAADVGGAGVVSYGQVLGAPASPVDHLRQVQAASVLDQRGPDGSLPPEVATLLYYAAAAALLCRGERTPGLDDAMLRRGLGWAVRQEWADPALRSVLTLGLERLRAGPAAAGDGEDTSDLMPPLTAAGAGDAPAPGPVAPQVPGYEVTGRLGQGGMGVVWSAVQRSTRRPVALKVIASGVIGSHRARLRFNREVELAARLEHPNIARVYDSGAHGGQFYYAMELVEGAHLDEYVAAGKLDRTRVLRLMRDVSLAVQHAHEKGVIHRDLKPGNILVDQHGRPRVLDFGLAKALAEAGEGPGRADASLTLDGDLAGTPAYMSPEQAAGKGSLDTRSDVYSLGVILYRLLTGRSPHDLSGSRLEVLRRISESDVQSPRRTCGPASIDAELEAILLKALAREPQRRYATAAALADDLGRYLRREPVSARPPTLGYLLRKRLARRKAASAAGVTLIVMLLSLAALVLYGKLRESRSREQYILQLKAEQARTVEQKRQAEEAAIRLTTINNFMNTVIGISSPDINKGQSVSVIDVLDDAVRQLDAGELSDLPAIEASLRFTVGDAYKHLGRYADAERNLRRAVQFGREDPRADQRELANCLIILANVREERNPRDLREPEALLREALEVQRKQSGPDSLQVAASMGQLGDCLLVKGDVTGAEDLFRRALGIQRRALGEDSNDAAVSFARLARVMISRHDPAGAEPLARAALRQHRKVPGGDMLSVVSDMEALATVLWQKGDLAGAEAQLREAIETERRRFGTGTALTAPLYKSLAAVLRERGDKSREEGLVMEQLQDNLARLDMSIVQGARDPKLPGARGDLLARLGRLQEAVAEFSWAVRANPAEHMSWYHLACLQLYLGDETGWRQTSRQMLERFGNAEEWYIVDRTVKTGLLARRPADEIAAAVPALERMREGGLWQSVYAQLNKGIYSYRTGNFEEAVRWLTGARSRFSAKTAQTTAGLFLAMAHHRLGHREQALDAFAEAMERADVELPKAGSCDLGQESLEDWLICQTIRREAEALIGPVDRKQGPRPIWIWGAPVPPPRVPTTTRAARAASHTSQTGPEWAAPGILYFRRAFDLDQARPVRRADLGITADDGFVLYVNGALVARRPADRGGCWVVTRLDLSPHLRPGRNVLAIEAENLPPNGSDHNPAGVLARLVVDYAAGRAADAGSNHSAVAGHSAVVFSDRQWRVTSEHSPGWERPEFNDGRWAAAQEVAPVNLGPWGHVELDPPPTAAELKGLRPGARPAVVPGILQAEDFDEGAEGVAYHDTTVRDNGSATPPYRDSSVDIDSCSDEGGGYNIGYIAAGEWLTYTIDAAEEGTYDLTFRVSSPAAGGKFHVELDGKETTGAIGVPNTGGWHTWQTIGGPRVSMTKGRHKMRVVFDAGPDAGGTGFVCNLNWIGVRKHELPHAPARPPTPD